MKVDTYTKVVLTVIAACLVYMVAKDVEWIPTAHAQDAAAPRPPIKVEVVNQEQRAVKVEIVEAGDDFDEYVPVVIRGLELDPDDADGSLPIYIRDTGDGILNRLPVSSN